MIVFFFCQFFHARATSANAPGCWCPFRKCSSFNNSATFIKLHCNPMGLICECGLKDFHIYHYNNIGILFPPQCRRAFEFILIKLLDCESLNILDAQSHTCAVYKLCPIGEFCTKPCVGWVGDSNELIGMCNRIIQITIELNSNDKTVCVYHISWKVVFTFGSHPKIETKPHPPVRKSTWDCLDPTPSLSNAAQFSKCKCA